MVSLVQLEQIKLKEIKERDSRSKEVQIDNIKKINKASFVFFREKG